MRYSSKEVAKMTGFSWVLTRTWAKKNGVQKRGLGKGSYSWTEEDIARFVGRIDGRTTEAKVGEI